MAYQSGKTYYLIPICATGDPAYNAKILRKEVQPISLNIQGTGAHTNNRNVNVWPLDWSSDMQWKVIVGSGFARILCAGNEAFGLDYYYGSDNPRNCDIYKVSGNGEDSKINFRTVSSTDNLYKLQCYRNDKDNDLYLTVMPDANGRFTGGCDVRWQPQDSSKASQQVWWLVPIEDVQGGTSGSNATVENLNQNNYGTQTGENTFCYATCILAIMRHYKGASFTMDRLISEGIVRGSDGFVLKNDSSYHSITKHSPIDFTEICNEIRQGKPVVIHGYSKTGDHYVVADGFTSQDASGIIVMDPWTGTHVRLTESTLRSYIEYRKYINK